jgi:hypothetical protein
MASTVIVLVDRTKPELGLDIQPTEVPSIQKGKDLVFSGTASDDVGVENIEYRIDGLLWQPLEGALIGGALIITIPTDALSPGSHYLEVRISDSAGNQDMEATSLNVRKVPTEDGLSSMVIGGVVAAVIMACVIALLLTRRGSRSEPTGLESQVEPKDEPSTPDGIEIDDPVEPPTEALAEKEAELEAPPAETEPREGIDEAVSEDDI